MSDNPYRQPSPRKMGKLRKALILWAGLTVALVAVAELAASLTMGIHLNGKESAPYLREAAQKLKTKPEWKLISDDETLHPYSCLVFACPTMRQVWDLGMESVNCPQLHQLLRDSGYEVVTRRPTFTPEANEQAENCTQVLDAVSSDAKAGGGRLDLNATVYPPSIRVGSEREHYELVLRLNK
jgi:hypothetical protein